MKIGEITHLTIHTQLQESDHWFISEPRIKGKSLCTRVAGRANHAFSVSLFRCICRAQWRFKQPL